MAAFDLTFSAPKSVSVLFAIGEPALARALVEAHEPAVDAALGYLEREACRSAAAAAVSDVRWRRGSSRPPTAIA